MSGFRELALFTKNARRVSQNCVYITITYCVGLQTEDIIRDCRPWMEGHETVMSARSRY